MSAEFFDWLVIGTILAALSDWWIIPGTEDFCHRKLQKSYPFANYKLVSGCGHVGYPGEHLAEYCAWLSAAARGDNMI